VICGRDSDRNSHIKEDNALEFWKLFTISIDDEDGKDILVNDNNKNYVYPINGVSDIFIRNNLNPFIKFVDKG